MRAYKTEINPTDKQKHIIHQTIGNCRFIYNFYLAHNKEIYEKEKKFVSGIEFSKWLNNDFIPNNLEYKWIKDVSSKAIKQAIINGEKAFKRFFIGKSKFPRFKKLKREQRKLSRKYESLKKKIKKKEDATRRNISKQIVKVQILHQKLTNIRHNYINQVINEVAKNKPKHITIEDLNVKGMMKNRHLAKAVAKQNFYNFRIKLENKCKISNIELRVVSRFYPSSKTCSCCGYIKKDLKLSDRVYICDDCGFEIDRDLNASINLANAKIYKIA